MLQTEWEDRNGDRFLSDMERMISEIPSRSSDSLCDEALEGVTIY